MASIAASDTAGLLTLIPYSIVLNHLGSYLSVQVIGNMFCNFTTDIELSLKIYS